ncbi:MAG: uL15 family ribosomal protein [Nanoarchaeota archaeon]|nr:uL15 family ribosomal protein [Nanoarchaeota archaeon]
MVVRKRTKFSRQRASFTHGWGSKKKHRGAGSRGGKGMAGTGKRADQRKPSIWKDKKYFGKYGFTSLSKKIKTINVKELLSLIGSDSEEINLRERGYGKLIGKGNITKKVMVSVNQASAVAIKKVEAAGGKVTLLKKQKENVAVQDNNQ